MRRITNIGDVIETVEPVQNGSLAGNRLAVVLTNDECCRFADKLIRLGRWRIREEKREERE